MKELRVKVSGDSSGIDQVVRELNQKTAKATANFEKSWSGAMSGGLAGGISGFFAALSLPSIISSIQGVFGKVREIRELGEQFDLSAEAVQKWSKSLDKAGITSNLFFRSLETVRNKRQAARDNPKDAQAFEDVGLGAAAVGYDMTDEELLVKVLQSGASRPRINALLGRGGARLGAALPYLANAKAPFSNEEVESLDESRRKAEGLNKKISNGVTRFWASMADLLDPVSLALNQWQYWKMGSKRYIAAQRLKELNKKLSEEMATDDDRKENERIDAEHREKATRKARQEHEERMSDLKRGSMDPDEQRTALTAELMKTRREIDELESRKELAPDDQERLMRLQERQQGIKNSLFNLREKPLSWQATPLEKAGAVFTNSLLFNPVLQIQTQQLSVLKSIDETLKGRGNDPWGGIS